VQALLESNREARHLGQRARTASLLAGLVFDETGRRLTPSHTRKGGKRDRYYISRVASPSSSQLPQLPISVPAHDLERLVLEQVELSSRITVEPPASTSQKDRSPRYFQARFLVVFRRERWTGGYIFENEWQSFRTRQSRDLELTTAMHTYDRHGRYTVAVKVIDIFGNDTMTLVLVNVGYAGKGGH
jgi:hypothetical protein